MKSIIEWFLRDNHWIRMVLLNLPLQLFAVNILELLVGKMKHKGYMIGFMLVRTTLLCYFQSLSDQISVSGHLTEIVLGALGSIGACLLCIYLVEAEPIRVLFAIAISELSAMPVMVFSMVVLNWLEKRPEGMFGWYLAFRPEDLLAWIFELLSFIPIYAIMKKIQILFRNYEIPHTRLIWIIYLEYFLVMQTSQLIPIATEDGTRRGMVLPCLIVAAAATLGLVKIFSNQKEKIRTESQFLQLELTMMQSQYQAMQYQRTHIEESRKLIDRQMQYQDGLIKLVSAKTKNAKREIYLNAAMRLYLTNLKNERERSCSEHEKVQKQNQTFICDMDGKMISSLELVNCLPNGKIQTNNSMKYHAKMIKERYGFTFKYHYLRHTYGTALAEMNTPAHILCKQMGHGKINTTQQYYLALSPSGIEMLKNNLDKL